MRISEFYKAIFSYEDDDTPMILHVDRIPQIRCIVKFVEVI
jgi:hypothetical protein